jgi:hypothetical protein
MKNRDTVFTTILFALAFALAPIVQAAPQPGGGPVYVAPPSGGGDANSEASSAYSTSPEGEQRPVITISGTGNVNRGKTGSFVLHMTPPIMFGGTYINFSVSGTAIPGVDYVLLVSPAYIGPSGYGVILVETLPDPRAPSIRRTYDVVVTLERGFGYAMGEPRSAKIAIMP